jgi:type II secretory pathway component PulK
MKQERGFILVVVVWALTVLMVISAELARTMRIEGLTTMTYQEENIAYYLALAGFHRALYQIVRAGQQGRTLLTPTEKLGEEASQEIWARGDGRWHSEEFGAGGYWVQVSDESAKINLNQVDEATLRQTFTNLSFDAKVAEELSDAIQDWRDTDSLVRLHGAESDYYLSLPIAYPAKDGLFDTLEELQLVRGVTSELFYGGFRELFTVYSSTSGEGGTNLLTAGPLVLQAVLGIDKAAALDIVQRRAETGGADVASLVPGGGTNFALPVTVTIDSIGYLNSGGVTRRVSGVVQRQGVNGFRFLRWQDRQEGGTQPPPPPQEEED